MSVSEQFAKAFEILAEGVTARAFAGFAARIDDHNDGGCASDFGGGGHFTYEPESPAVTHETIFDVASLTKVVATTAMAMLLVDRGVLQPGTHVAELLPGFAASDPRKRSITMRMLLAHNSGLPGYVRLFEQAPSPEKLLQAAIEMPLSHEPLTHAEYSDIGFIVLGAALEMIAGESIANFCEREVFAPLQMSSTLFVPPEALRPSIPPTENDAAFRHRVIQGEVHDENASVLGGIAGHAGLFSNVHDLSHFGGEMLRAWHGKSSMFTQPTVQLFTRRTGVPEDTSRALGWDTPSQPSQSGQYLSENSFGHLGFTGTSLWIDPERKLVVTLLTNRTWPDRSNQAIKQIRPRFHDAVIEDI